MNSKYIFLGLALNFAFTLLGLGDEMSLLKKEEEEELLADRGRREKPDLYHYNKVDQNRKRELWDRYYNDEQGGCEGGYCPPLSIYDAPGL